MWDRIQTQKKYSTQNTQVVSSNIDVQVYNNTNTDAEETNTNTRDMNEREVTSSINKDVEADDKVHDWFVLYENSMDHSCYNWQQQTEI